MTFEPTTEQALDLGVIAGLQVQHSYLVDNLPDLLKLMTETCTKVNQKAMMGKAPSEKERSDLISACVSLIGALESIALNQFLLEEVEGDFKAESKAESKS